MENIKGLDVSMWQKTINWSKIDTDEYKFVFVRARNSNRVQDPTFEYNFVRAKEIGMMVGAYQYFIPDKDPEKQAELFLQSLDKVGGLGSDDMPPVMDIESNGVHDRDVLIKNMNTWIRIIKKETKKTPIIYTYPSFWNTLRVYDFKEYPLWIAHYTKKGSPLVPKPWENWTFWQYTGSGDVEGIKTPVDKSVFNGGVDDLKKFIEESNIVGTIPPPKPIDSKTISYINLLSDIIRDSETERDDVSIIMLSPWQRFVLFIYRIIDAILSKIR